MNEQLDDPTIYEAVREHIERQAREDRGETPGVYTWADIEALRPMIDVVSNLVAIKITRHIAASWEPIDAESVEEVNSFVPVWLMGVAAGYQHVADMNNARRAEISMQADWAPPQA